jgi:hypothetical protein
VLSRGVETAYQALSPPQLARRTGLTRGRSTIATRDPDRDLRPSEVLRRNFWFCSLDDPSTLSTRHVIGVENIMLESDYPHGDSTWPDSQLVIDEFYGELPVEEIRMMTHLNASKLYRHPLPDICVP